MRDLVLSSAVHARIRDKEYVLLHEFEGFMNFDKIRNIVTKWRDAILNQRS